MEQQSRRRRNQEEPQASTETKLPDYYQNEGAETYLNNSGVMKRALPDGGFMIIKDGQDR